MRAVPIIGITDALLTSSTVIETTPAAYAAGTTYAAAALVTTGTVGGALTVWKSLAAGNIGHTPASSPTWWQNLGEVYAEYAAGTTYALGAVVQVAATHKVYESLIAGNIGNPVTDIAKWLDKGATNKWKMFDLLRNSATTVPGSLTVVIAPGERVNSIGLRGLVANAAEVTVTSVVGGGTVYHRTLDLNTREVLDWYMYAFEPFSTKQAFALFDLPPYTDAVITVTLTATSGNVSCDRFAVGTYEYMGEAQNTAEIDALNFSAITRNSFGDATLTPRPNVPKLNPVTWVEKPRVIRLLNLKNALNAVPAMWAVIDDVDDPLFEAFLLFGIYKRFSINTAPPAHAVVTLELEEV